MTLKQRILASAAPRATILIRAVVGWVFLTEGIQKFLFPDSLGVGRFAKIGIPNPSFTAPLVGIVEIVFGALIIVGLLTRLSAISLLIDISVAIATTKIPILIDKGFWAGAHESRTDLCMLFGLLFLLFEGAGPFAIDWYLSRRTQRPVLAACGRSLYVSSSRADQRISWRRLKTQNEVHRARCTWPSGAQMYFQKV